MADSTVTYEQLNDLSAEFDDAETELIRQDVIVKAPLYEKRQKLIAQIPNFWPLVFEQASPDIDEFIQPSDSSLLLNSLVNLTVSRFEIEDGGKGDPRSLLFRFEFNENEHFEDKVIEKKFWQRKAKCGWTGLVSEPVEIQWKKGKDLTGGLLGTVKKVWAARQAQTKDAASKASKDLTIDERALKKKIEDTGLGSMSFFAWFGYVGHNVSAEESQEATETARRERLSRQAGDETTDTNGANDGGNDEDDHDDENELEIFPEGETLAIAISEDLWPNAIKYFTQAQEQDEVSDDDFESEAGDEKEGEEETAYSDEEPPPAKRLKT
ncbi:nucleosome assembly protein [Coniella lustricola]|uniref:Nucleosome assembly protein n=1 Tax=Coniella lustricola TaxID=2025994 RepID=A0A2T3AJK5_9PEZI|nr:nucleosome assembly protein [Coniella lustricola]